jgi:hypothetical protein
MRTRKYLVVITIAVWLILANIAQAETVDPKIIHLLNRLSYGIRPGDLDRVKTIGIDRYIQQQLNPDNISESTALTDRLAKLETINFSPVELFQ